MRFPPFEHVDFLARAWQDGAPRHNLGGSGLAPPPWSERGLPPLGPEVLDPATVDLHAGTDLRDRLAERDGVATLVTAGTSGANLALLQALLEPGDHVLCERPYYAPLPNLARALGADVEFVDRDAAWRLRPEDVAARLRPTTRLVLLTSPHNPTGAVASEPDLRRLGEMAEEVDAHVLVDQVYRELTDQPVAAVLHPRLVTTSGLNKCWGAPGLRVGWLQGDPDIVARATLAHRTQVLAPSKPGTRVAHVLLDHEAACRKELEDRLGATHKVWDAWRKKRGLEIPSGPHALTAFCRLTEGSDEALCERALQQGVLLLAGTWFGRPGRHRIGLGGPSAQLEAALEALETVLDGRGA